MWMQTAAALLTCCLWLVQAQSIWDDPIKFTTKAKDSCTMTVTGQGEFTRLRLSCQGSKRSYWCDYLGKPYTCRAYNKNPRHFFVQLMWILRKLPNACLAPRNIRPHMCRKEPSDDSQMVFSAASFARSEASSRTAQRPQQAGPQQAGPQQAGPQQAGPQPARPQPARPQPARPQPAGRLPAGRQPARPQPARPQPAGRLPAGRQPAGRQPVKPHPAPTRPDSVRQVAMKTTQRAATGPTSPPVESHAKRKARQYCWRSMQGLCSFLIGWLPQ